MIFLADNPSHKKRVHFQPSAVPALLASTSFSIVVILPLLDLTGFEDDVLGRKISTMFVFSTKLLSVDCVIWQVVPNSDGFVESVSLACDVKLGSSIMKPAHV